MATPQLYDYPASANCYKVRLLLAQLGAEVERIPIDIFDGDTLTDDYARLNPRRETPVLRTAEGRVLTESNAILWYLASGTAFLSADAGDQAETLRWLIYEQTDVMPAIGGLRFRVVTGRLAPDSPQAEERRRNGYDVLRLLDAHLSSRPFLVGERYSIADIAVFGYAHLAAETGYALAGFGHFRNWLQRVSEQPRFMNDLAPYPPNASATARRSIYG
jgi:glutathione S-transferase